MRARHLSKPPEGTALDVNHPSCPDYCWPFNSIVGTPKPLCRTQQLTDPGSSTLTQGGWMVPGPSKYGPSVRHTGTGNYAVLATSGEADQVVGLSQFTLLIASMKTDATLRNSTVFGYDTLTTANRCQIHCPFSDGTIYFDYGGAATGGGGRVQAASLTFGDDLFCFNTGPRGQEIWQNGILRAIDTNPGLTRGTGGGGATGQVGFPANSTFSDLNDTSLVMTWRRQLAAAEIRALMVNPWQVFETQSLLGYDYEAAGGGGGGGQASAMALMIAP